MKFRSGLLGTTALAAANLLTASGASAADRISLGLGGYYQFFGVFAEEDDGPGEAAAGFRDHGFAREGEIELSGEMTLDNGLAVGVNIELEAETSGDQIDESYVYFEGRWGRLELGSNDGAPDSMFYGAPTPIDGHGVNSPNFFHPNFGGNTVGSSITFIGISSDSDKATYFTPQIWGFQFGISYTPDNTEELGGGLRPDATAGQQSKIVEAAVNWTGQFGPASLTAYVGGATADLEVAAPGLEDQDQWGLGVSVGWGGFTFGASYKDDDLGVSGSSSDRWDANVGLIYSTGPWTFGVAYAHAEVEAGPGLGEDELDGFELGGSYALGLGISLSGGLQHWDFEDNLGAPGSETDSTILLFGTSISF